MADPRGRTEALKKSNIGILLLPQCSAICIVFGVGPFPQTLSVKCFVGSDVNV